VPSNLGGTFDNYNSIPMGAEARQELNTFAGDVETALLRMI
jgi:hypothetical protein